MLNCFDSFITTTQQKYKKKQKENDPEQIFCLKAALIFFIEVLIKSIA